MTHRDEIVDGLLEYIYSASPAAEDAKPLPLDQSLYELGVLDSFAVVELVDHVEQHWEIRILDSEITHEKFGGVNKMANLIMEKLVHEEAKAGA